MFEGGAKFCYLSNICTGVSTWLGEVHSSHTRGVLLHLRACVCLASMSTVQAKHKTPINSEMLPTSRRDLRWRINNSSIRCTHGKYSSRRSTYFICGTRRDVAGMWTRCNLTSVEEKQNLSFWRLKKKKKNFKQKDHFATIKTAWPCSPTW